MPPLLTLAGRQLRAHALRTGLTVSGVAFGVALVIAIRVINASTLASFTDAMDDLAGAAALQVRGAGPFPEEVAERVGAVPGVAHAVPIITAAFFAVDPPVAGEALSVFAADVTDGHAVRTLHLVESGERVVDDPLAFLVDPRSVILTDVFAARAGIAKGDRIRLRTPVGVESFTVRGLLPPAGVGRAFGGNLLVMDVIGAQVVLRRERTIDQVDVELASGVAVETARARIDAVLDGGLEAVPSERRGEQIERYLASFATLLSGISGLALLSALFLVASAVATSVAARRSEIGLLRCAGARRREIVRLFLGEAALTGVLGSALGVPLGLLLARLLIGTVTQSAELIFSMTMFRGDLEVTPATIALGLAAGLLASLLAGWLPARAAARVSPITVVRSEPDRLVRRWPVAVVAGVAAPLGVGGLWAEMRFNSPWSGNVAALALDAALVCLVMRAAGPVARTVLGPLRSALGFAGRLAVDRLAAIPNPLALAAGVLALALGLMIMAATLADSFEESVLDFIRRQVRADLVVASTATTGWIEAPVDEAIGDRLAAVPGVARVERVRLAEHEYQGSRISVDSLEASAFASDRRADFAFSAGDPDAALAAVRTGTGVIVSQNFARHFAVGVGDTLHLETPSGPYHPRVVGVAVDYVSPRGSVVMSRTVWQQWWGDRAVNRFHVTLAPGADAVAVRRAIATGIGAAEGLKVLTQRELYAYHQDAVRRAFRITKALEVLPLIVAALGLAEALLAVSLDRRREFALLRAAGATRAQVGRAVVLESAGVGTVGLVGGFAIGLVLAVVWVRVNFTYQLGWEIDFHFATGSLWAAALAALAVSVPAGLAPAWRVARMPVLEALRGE
jgi:putative ABC transport system permease protein